MWAILSAIEGNIAAYKAVLADLKRQRVKIEELYILGDIVAANPFIFDYDEVFQVAIALLYFFLINLSTKL